MILMLCKRFGTLLLLLFFLAPFYAQLLQIDCNLELDEGFAKASMVLYLHSEDPANYFSLEMPMHQDFEILNISDSLGPIKDYSINNGVLQIKTNSSAKRKEELIKINGLFSGLDKESFAGATIAEFSLAAEQGTRVNFHASGIALYGFDSSAGFKGTIKNGALSLSGKGPLFARFVYSSSGKRFGRFVVFAEDIEDENNIKDAFERASELYFIVPNILGVEPACTEFPVVVLKDEKYDERINNYSAGTYVTGGLIVLKEGTLKKKIAAVPIILHELTHSFNAKVFAWNSSDTSWLDEGLAKFVEYVASKQLGIRVPNLFYGVQRYSDGRYEYTIEPSSDINALKHYYDSNSTFMAEWNTNYESTRDFGYAFAELFVRWYIAENDFNALHNSMRALAEVKNNVYDSHEFTRIVLEKLNVKMEPCKMQSEAEMLSCINTLNNFNPKIPQASILKLGLESNESMVPFDIWAVRRKNLQYKFEELHAHLIAFLEKLISTTEALSK